MKKLFFLFLVIPTIVYCQVIENPNVYSRRDLIRGNTGTLTFNVRGNYASDSLLFVLKVGEDINYPRLLQKGNYGTYTGLTATYGNYTTITISIAAYQTAGYGQAGYYFDITKLGIDTTTILRGILNILPTARNLADGTYPPLSVIVVALDSSDQEPGVLIGRNSNNTQDWWSLETLGDSLGVITGSEADLDSLYTYWVNKHEAQTITGQKNFTADTTKFGADTSMSIGGLDQGNGFPLFLNWNTGKNYGAFSKNDFFTVVPPGKDSVSDWTMKFETWNFLGIMGHGMYWGLNQNHRRPLEPQFTFVCEAPYRYHDTTEVYEWYYHWANKFTAPDYVYRPWGLTIYYYRDPITNLQTSDIPLVEVASAIDQIVYMDKDRNFISQMNFDGSGSSSWQIYDTTYILYGINNDPWLYQADTSGNSKELIRIDNNNDVLISPGGDGHIRLGTPLRGNINWWNGDRTEYITIIADTSDNKIKIGNNNGMKTQSIDVTYFPTDTTGLLSGKLYVDPNNGNVKYTIPEDILLNGAFTDWTLGDPDDWSVQTEDAGNYVEESPTGELHFVTDGSLYPPIRWGISQSILDVGTTYGFSYTVTTATSDTVVVTIGGNNYAISSVGDYTGEATATDEEVVIRENYGAADITFDNFKVWVQNGAAKQATYDYFYAPISFDAPTTDDLIFLGWKYAGANYDSIGVFDIQDSVAFQVYYDDGSTHNMFTTVDTLTTGTTLVFNVSDVPAGAKVYLDFIYLGDSEAYLRSQIYWRE